MKLDGKTVQEAIMQIVQDYKFDAMQIVEIVNLGIKSAFKKDYYQHRKDNIKVHIDEAWEIHIYKILDVVEVIEDTYVEIDLKEAQKHRSDIKLGEQIFIDITPESLEFSRIAIQSAAQTIQQHIKTIQKERFFDKFETKQWELMKGKVIKSINNTVVLDIDGVPVVLPVSGQIPGKMYDIWEDVFVYLNDVSKGQWVINLDITQTSEWYIEAIIRKIVPEIEDWTVKIHDIVRVPGVKTKIVVFSEDKNVDPIWVMVWQWWDRINIVLSLLDGERVDYISYSDDVEEIIKQCLKPAIIQSINIRNGVAKVKVPEKQKALAIWRWASNIKLTSRLVNMKIEIV